jgi:uncharacterized protein (DUF2384 family)
MRRSKQSTRLKRTPRRARRIGKKASLKRKLRAGQTHFFSWRAVGKTPEQVLGSAIPNQFISGTGLVVVEEVANWFGMSKVQLASTVGVRPETLQRLRRVNAAKTQGRVKEMLEIIGRVVDWAGGKDQAMAWYRAEPLPAFGGRTAEALVKEGKAGAVRDYLDHIALGGFA